MPNLWRAIACHEMGHVLGLNHNTTSINGVPEPSIMKTYTVDYYNYFANGTPRWYTPKDADVGPINMKY